MPVMESEARLIAQIEHAGLVHPLAQRFVRLRGEVNQDTAFGLRDGGLDNRIQGLITVHQHGRRKACIEPHQRAMRAIRVETEERLLLIN